MATAERSLGREELRTLAILGVPTFALALAITTVSTYLPVLAEDFSKSSIVVGLLIGGEGLMALWLPLVVGSWSDRVRTPIGSRLPFIIAATPPLVVSLALLGFVNSIAAAAVALAIFFAAYFVAYEPYRALYPDLLDDEIAGRAQSSQAIFRGLGTFLALLGGGLLISIAKPLPFVAAAAVVAISLGAFIGAGLRYRRRERPRKEEPVAATARRVLDLVRGDHTLQAFLAANALWELALAALKTFIVLYVTKTLGFSLAGSSAAIAAGALFILLGALVSGPLGDRMGRARVMRWSLVVYGLGLLVPFLTTAAVPLVVAVPFIAFGGGVTMSLPYALLMPMMPPGQHGAVTGLYSLSRGLGTALGPLLAGVAIQVAGHDYRWMWVVCAAAILASIPVMRPLRDTEADGGR
ncbi:MAG: transporter, family, tetracycline resistance protein [Solirubrobacteraceae bacterium]|jgi:MFS family permease|nr:transporter, family, tetracycline resistance protein [Solirubrobacteraceae bacterium]